MRSFFRALFTALYLSHIFSTFAVVCAESDDRSLYRTKHGTIIQRSLLLSTIGYIDEAEWSNHIFEIHGSGKDMKLVGSSFTHSFSNANIEHHSPHDPLLGSVPPVYIDDLRMPSPNFTYTSFTTASARVLMDAGESVFSVFLEDSVLHPVDQKNNVSLFISYPKMPRLESNSSPEPHPSPFLPHVEHVGPVRLNVRNASGSLPRQMKCIPADSPAVLQLAITFDSTLCQRYDGHSSRVIALLFDFVQQAMIPFHIQTCIRHTIVHYSGYCSKKKDPYQDVINGNKAVDILYAFRNLWNSPMYRFSNVSRHLTYLFTDQIANDGQVGITFRDCVCSSTLGYAWTNSNANISTISHELGHGFSAKHDKKEEDGIMNTYRDRRAQKQFSKTSLRRFREFIYGRGRCLFNSIATNPGRVIKNHKYTCETGFKKMKKRPRRTTWKLTGTSFGKREKILSVIYAYIKLNRYDFELSIYVQDKKYRIKNYYRMPSMTPIRSVRKLGPYIQLPRRYMTSVLWSKWTWAEVNRPLKLQTCCGAKFYIAFRGYICRKNYKGCFWVSKTFTMNNLVCS